MRKSISPKSQLNDPIYLRNTLQLCVQAQPCLDMGPRLTTVFLSLPMLSPGGEGLLHHSPYKPGLQGIVGRCRALWGSTGDCRGHSGGTIGEYSGVQGAVPLNAEATRLVTSGRSWRPDHDSSMDLWGLVKHCALMWSPFPSIPAGLPPIACGSHLWPCLWGCATLLHLQPPCSMPAAHCFGISQPVDWMSHAWHIEPGP